MVRKAENVNNQLLKLVTNFCTYHPLLYILTILRFTHSTFQVFTVAKLVIQNINTIFKPFNYDHNLSLHITTHA